MAKHELHQFDLKAAAAKRLVAGIDLQQGESVFEVGPGLGAITEQLLAAGAQVHAVELDQERAQALRERFADALADGRMQLLIGDAQHMLPLCDDAWRIVANPPFKMTATFLRQWILEDLPSGPPQRLDLVLQKQAAEKWLASDQEQTRSSVLLKLWGKAQIKRELQRNDVEPPSHVDLCSLHVQRHEHAASPEQLRSVDKLLAIAFAGPKTVREALRKICTPAIFKRQSKEQRWSPDEHPRYLSPQAWMSLADFLRSIRKI